MACPTPLHPSPSLIQRHLAALASPSPPTSTAASAALCATLDSYLPLPALLDPLLPTLLPPLFTLAATRLDTLPPPPAPAPPSHLEPVFTVLYTAAKVRGLKALATYFPHQVRDLHYLARALHRVESHHALPHLWHARYILYAWAAVAIRLPFPLATVLHAPLLHALVAHARLALHYPGPVAAAAAAFLARLLARRDAAAQRTQLLAWACDSGLRPDEQHAGTRVAALALLAATLKFAHRDDVAPFVLPAVRALCVLAADEYACSSTSEAHLVTKTAARAALAVLPRRAAPWRYMRGERVVFARGGGGLTRRVVTGTGYAGAGAKGEGEGEVVKEEVRAKVGHVGEVQEGEGEEEELDVDGEEVLESVVELLLVGLQHRDTVVRWSAAKGVGRVTGRLPLLLAQDVADSVLELFSHMAEARADAAWHGGCLAAAELARRGLLLPRETQFRSALSVVAKAARFDVRRGANSVGAHVRDAACYAVWAIARAYAKEEVAPFAGVIVEGMLPMALLDREVNCRRAAAAALQECVGRLSEQLFPAGIELVTAADYFSLGDRTTAYLTIAPQVASMAGGRYFDCILNELLTKKLAHWDLTIRTLAAQALGNLVAVDKGLVILGKAVPQLIALATQKGDTIVRHGAVVGLAEIVKASGSTKLGDVGTQIRGILGDLKDRRLFAGRTGNELRLGCSSLVESLATEVGGVYTDSTAGRTDAEDALNFLESILGCGKEDMYDRATSAYAALCKGVIAKDVEWHVSVTRRILRGISEATLLDSQRGFALAAGICGESRISGEVVDVLCREVIKSRDVEVRRNAAISLGRLHDSIMRSHAPVIFDALTAGIYDYFTDERGDVGSWVREASMRSVSTMIERIFEKAKDKMASEQTEEFDKAILNILRGVVQQCCGRIDRTRVIAGSSLMKVCRVLAFGESNTTLGSLFKTVAECFGIFPEESETASHVNVRCAINFQDTQSVFPAVRRALSIDAIAKAVIVGFVSAGGGFGHQSRAALDAMVAYFREEGGSIGKKDSLKSIVDIVSNEDERLIVPAFKVLETLAKRGALTQFGTDELLGVVRAIRASWRGKLRDVRRTTAAVQLLGELAALSLEGYCFDFRDGTIGRECLEAVAVVLGGSIPRLRRIAAECIYMTLIEFAREDEDTTVPEDFAVNACRGMDEALNVLLETEWEQLSTLVARERRNLLCRLLRIKTPSPAKTNATPTSQ